MEINDYVRTIDGCIGKIIPSGFQLVNQGIYGIKVDNDNILFGDNYNNITKHSKDILDIIEVGDYVNGEYVIGFGKFVYDDGTEERTSLTLDINCQCLQKDIKSVLTKELFEANAYTIEKKNDS